MNTPDLTSKSTRILRVQVLCGNENFRPQALLHGNEVDGGRGNNDLCQKVKQFRSYIQKGRFMSQAAHISPFFA